MAVQTAVKPKESFRILPKGKIARREALWFWFFISPWAIGFLVFTLYPIIASFYYSLTRYNIASDPVYIGFENYVSLWNDRVFWKSIQVTGYFTIMAVPLSIVVGLLVAVLLNQKVPFLGVFRTIFYMPSLLAGSVAVVLMFQWLLNPQWGFINYAIRALVGADGIIPIGWNGPRWLQDPNWVIPAHTLLALWGFGGTMLIYLSALQGVPTALYEAAEIDGATRVGQFFNITLPMISPVILFTFITGTIAAMQSFTQAYILSGDGGAGAPAYSQMFYNLYLFLQTFRRYRVGIASAMAWIQLVVVLLLTLAMFAASRRYVHYESDEEGAL